jgi:hypothetical protein
MKPYNASHYVLSGLDWGIYSDDVDARTYPATVPGNVQADLERAGTAAPLAALLDATHCHAVRRTSLDLSVVKANPDSGMDELTLRIRNTGSMTALFCEPHPVAEYRTDLVMENNQVSVPPGEERTISIRAPREPRGGLSLAQTGWRLTCWNADDAVIAPGDGVLLAVGRRDAMCGTFPIGECPRLMDEGRHVDFTFEATETTAVRLRIHTADQSANESTVVEATVNGHVFEQSLPHGYGFQRDEPGHLADPATLTFTVPAEFVNTGVNQLCVHTRAGWFTWDALDLIHIKPGVAVFDLQKIALTRDEKNADKEVDKK